jgi:hypothetical protein
MVSNRYRSYSLVPLLQLNTDTKEMLRSRAVRPPKHNPAKPHCFLTQCPLNPEASRTNVSEETQYTWRPCQCALRPARHRSRYRAMGQEHPCRPNSPLPRMTLGQLCATPWVSRSAVCDRAWTELGSIVAQLTLRCSALNHCGDMIIDLSLKDLHDDRSECYGAIVICLLGYRNNHGHLEACGESRLG